MCCYMECVLRIIQRITHYQAGHAHEEEEKMKEKSVDICPLCRGDKRPGTTTFTAELGFGVVVVRNVPASVCSQCGADWIGDEVARSIETIVEQAKDKHLAVEVISL